MSLFSFLVVILRDLSCCCWVFLFGVVEIKLIVNWIWDNGVWILCEMVCNSFCCVWIIVLLCLVMILKVLVRGFVVCCCWFFMWMLRLLFVIFMVVCLIVFNCLIIGCRRNVIVIVVGKSMIVNVVVVVFCLIWLKFGKGLNWRIWVLLLIGVVEY